MLSSTLFVFASLLCSLQAAFSAPGPPFTSGQSITLSKRQRNVRSAEELTALAKNERESLKLKYGGSPPSKRSEGTNLMTNQNTDASYIGSLAIGTPPTSFYVTLDTGSSDLWVADVGCSTGCPRNLAAYNSTLSSTFQNLSQPFTITYGIGQVAGSLVSDVVQMAGFSINNQTFGAATQLSQDFMSYPVSGLLGLAWQGDAASDPVPLWQTLANSGAWSEPVMSFQLTRFLNDSSARPLEPGGSFTMGFLNSSLYTGSVDYQNLVTKPRHWTLSLTQLTVQGSNLSLPSEPASHAAIDTGTTLVAGPLSVVQDLYARIPGSRPGTGDLQGYWTYPCSTKVNVAMSFGGPSWPVSPADFQFMKIGSNTCVGAFFAPNITGNVPDWIVGDTFLKNVYSVFRYSPPSVGFAELSATALAMNGVNAPPPSATIGSPAATVTAPHSTSGGALLAPGATFGTFWVVVGGMAVGAML